MDRTVPAAALALAAVLLLLTPAAAATSHDAMQAPQLSDGDVWTFSTRLFIPDSDPIDATATATYVGVETVGDAGTQAYRVDTAHEGQREGETFSVWYATSDFAKVQVVSASPSGSTTYTVEPPCGEWRFPMSVGASWSTSCTFTTQGGESFTIDSDWAVVRSESVTVPAGTFDAFVLEQTGDGFTERWWFAPDACYWVKHESADANGNLQASEELTSFTCATPQAATQGSGDGAETTADETMTDDASTGDGTTGERAAGDGTTGDGTTTDDGSSQPEGGADGGAEGAGGEAETPGPGVLLALVAVGVALVVFRAKRT